jgi:hypothetical protein
MTNQPNPDGTELTTEQVSQLTGIPVEILELVAGLAIAQGASRVVIKEVKQPAKQPAPSQPNYRFGRN